MHASEDFYWCIFGTAMTLGNLRGVIQDREKPNVSKPLASSAAFRQIGYRLVKTASVLSSECIVNMANIRLRFNGRFFVVVLVRLHSGG
jgi:hypothetical protein